MMTNDDPTDRPGVDWDRRDKIPVLTDIVDPAETGGNEPWLSEEASEVQEPPDSDDSREEPESTQPEVRFHDSFGVDEAKAAGLSSWDESALRDPAPEPADLDALRDMLNAEMHHAAARIVEESFVDVEGLLVERICARLKDEIRGIVGATLTDYERRRRK
jgi:hypothetical protein